MPEARHCLLRSLTDTFRFPFIVDEHHPAPQYLIATHYETNHFSKATTLCEYYLDNQTEHVLFCILRVAVEKKIKNRILKF